MLDGELLVRGAAQGFGGPAPRRPPPASTRFSKGSAARTSAKKMLGAYPAFVRLYDILFEGDKDLRELRCTERRQKNRRP